MTYQTNSFEMVKGDKKTFRVICRNPERTTQNLDDLLLTRGRFTIKTSTSATTYILRKATANVTGGADSQMRITDAENGVVEIYIAKDDFDGVDPGEYWFEVELSDNSNNPETVVQNTFKLLPELTDWEDNT